MKSKKISSSKGQKQKPMLKVKAAKVLASLPSKKMKSSNPRLKQVSKSDMDSDIIKLIMEDHNPLKKLIKTLKDWDSELTERKQAFEEFSLLLTTHANAEKEALYKVLERNEDLAKEGYEGEVEHSLAVQTLEAAMDDETEETWSAKVKVLAELVEHHIKEEESEMLPEFRKQSSPEERARIGAKYLALKKKNQHSDDEVDLDQMDEEGDSRSRDLVDKEEIRPN